MKRKRKSDVIFCYKIDGRVFTYSIKNASKFVDTNFPVNNTNLAINPDTEVFNVRLFRENHFYNNLKTVSDIQNFLKQNIYIKNTNIKIRQYNRKGIYSIEQVYEVVKDYLFDDKKTKVNLDGNMIKANSQRYQTFFTKGLTCKCCGIKGSYFAKEKFSSSKKEAYHLNLYAIDSNGQEVLMTKDHIIPKSKGGLDDISNYQTMCIICNNKKSNHIQ